MTEIVRGRFAAFFSPSIISMRGLLWFFPVGTLLILITVPRDGSVGLSDHRWWVAAVSAQSALTLVIAALSHIPACARGGRAGAVVRAVVVLLGGAARGSVLALVILWLEPPLAPAGSVPLRSANSALICCLWLGFIGVLIQAGRDYREQYRMLLSRAVALHRAERDSEIGVDEQMLERWASVQLTMRETSARIRNQLGEGEVTPTGAELAAAAAVVSEAVAQEVRPVSHGLWFTQAQEPPRLRAGALVWDALSDWRLPLRDIAVILCAIAYVGSIIRAGLVTGVSFATLYVVFSLLLLWVSDRLARRIVGPIVGIVTLIVMPWILLGIAIVIGQGILHVNADNGGAALAAGATSIVAFGMLLLSRVSGERRTLLQALQARIDSSAVVILARQERLRESEQELGVYLHHSVQSELSALALQLGEASNFQDAGLRKAARSEALERMLRIQESSPPWSAGTTGPDRISEIVRAWEGIARIDVTMPEVREGRPDQWKLITQAIEESIANAIRAGHADRIRIEVAASGGSLLLEVVDNGMPAAVGADSAPGLGTAWLNAVAPGQWSRSNEGAGSSLRLLID